MALGTIFLKEVPIVDNTTVALEYDFSAYQGVLIYGSTITLTGNFTVNATLASREFIKIFYRGASITYGAGSIVIFGRTLTQKEANSNLEITVSLLQGTTSVDVREELTDRQSKGIKLIDLAAGVASQTFTKYTEKTIVVKGTNSVATQVDYETSGSFADGDTFEVSWLAQLTASSFTGSTMFGTTLTVDDVYYGFYLKAVYSSTDAGFKVVKIPFKTVPDSYTAFGSFETGEQGAYRYYFTKKVSCTKVRVIVTKALSATDNGTVTIQKNGSGSDAIELPLSSVFGTQSELVYTQSFVEGDYIDFIFAKTTVGGKAQATVEFTPVNV